MRRLGLLALAAGTVGAFGAAAVGQDAPHPAARRYTLDECVRLAERSYPGVAAQRHKIAAARAQLDEAWAAPFLNFSVTGAASIAPYARGNPTFSPDAFAQNPFETGFEPFARLTVETAIPISPWTWWRLGRVRDAARAGVRANEHEAEKVRLELRTNVRRAFFALQLARDTKYLVGQGVDYLETAERQLAQMREGDAGGSVNDLHQLRASRAETLARREEVLAGERTALTTLRLLTGEGDGFDIVDEPLCPYETSLHPLSHYLTLARLHRPEVAMIDAGLSARRAAVSIQWGAYLPDLALGLSAAWSSAPSISDQVNPFAGGNQNFGYWGGALVLRWNADPLANFFRVRRLQEELAMTEAQQRLALGGIALEVSEVHARASAAQARERHWGDAERENYEWFTSVFQEYQAGTGEASAIISPLRQYLQSRASHLQAVSDLNTALAQLAQVTGRDAMDGAPSTHCARPAEAAPDTDAGVSDEEIEALLGQAAEEGADAGAPTDDVATDVATGGRRDAVTDQPRRPVNARPAGARTTGAAR
ncbi:MAG: TolC family protein [Polyangiales bacterium]